MCGAARLCMCSSSHVCVCVYAGIRKYAWPDKQQMPDPREALCPGYLSKLTGDAAAENDDDIESQESVRTEDDIDIMDE